MIKKTIKYQDYEGVEREEDFYFNLTKAEIAEWEMSVTGGFAKQVQKIISEGDASKLIPIFKEMILKSYGVKSPDGKRFIKSEELATEFSQTEAYSELFMSLATDADAAAEFVNGITPVME